MLLMLLRFPLAVAFALCFTAFAKGQHYPATYTTLEPPHAVSSAAYGISANGTIVGEFEIEGIHFPHIHSFTMSPAGEYSIFDIPFGISTYAYKINNYGSTVGGYSVQIAGAEHEFARLGTGKVEYYDPPRALVTKTRFVWINNHNQVSGDQTDSLGVTHGFVSDFLGPLTLFDVPGSSDTFGGVINDSGEIAGQDFLSTDRAFHAYLRDSFGIITLVDVPGAGNDAAEGTYITAVRLKFREAILTL